MTRPGDLHDDMERFALDPETGDRLLSGVLHPEDAPDRYSAVAALLQAAAVPTSGDLEGEAATVDAVVAAIRSAPGFTAPRTQRSRLGRAKIAAAGLVGALTLSSGLAAANALPGPAQNIASSALGAIGLHVPDGNANGTKGDDHPAGDDTSAQDSDQSPTGANGAAPAGDTTPTTHPDNKGGEVSDLAHTTPPGPDHGAVVSNDASNGKSQAGEDHTNPTNPSTPGGPPTSLPANSNADHANSAGNTSEGTTAADQHRNDASQSGQDSSAGRKP